MEENSAKGQICNVLSLVLSLVTMVFTVIIGIKALDISQISYYTVAHRAAYETGWIDLYRDRPDEAVETFNKLEKYYPDYRSTSEAITIIRNRGSKAKDAFWCDDILKKYNIDIATTAVDLICNEQSVKSKCEDACSFRKGLRRKNGTDCRPDCKCHL